MMFKIKTVYAHCDIPCGIYETDTMKHSADTCKIMTEKIAALGDSDGSVESRNNYVRMVMNKERHAQKVKDEVCILWSDYFKPEHLEAFPELHETLWKAVKQASKVKQTCDAVEADELVARVAAVMTLFADSKK